MKFLQLSWADFGKGLILALITSIVMSLKTIVLGDPSAIPPVVGHFPIGSDWIAIGIAAFGAFVAYLGKNFLTNSDDKFLKKEPVLKTAANEHI